MKTIYKSRVLKRISNATKEIPVTAATLTNWMNPMRPGRPHKDPSNRQARLVVTELIKEGHPIGSNSKGFFPITTEREMQVYLNDLMKRQVAMSVRIGDVYHAFYGKGA